VRSAARRSGSYTLSLHDALPIYWRGRTSAGPCSVTVLPLQRTTARALFPIVPCLAVSESALSTTHEKRGFVFTKPLLHAPVWYQPSDFTASIICTMTFCASP